MGMTLWSVWHLLSVRGLVGCTGEMSRWEQETGQDLGRSGEASEGGQVVGADKASRTAWVQHEEGRVHRQLSPEGHTS